jgi:RND family efflux transporter MFP subunit
MLSASSAAVRHAACSIAIGAVLTACNQQNAYVPPPPPKVDVAMPVKQTVTPYLNATGSTATVNSTTLIARVGGFIQEINYKDGDSVKAGQQLFLIEPQPYELALDQAQAGKASADAQVKQSEVNLKREQDLVAKKIDPQSALDAAVATNDANVAAQQTADANVKQAQLNLSYTQVKAPFDGIVTARQISMGQLVAAGTSTLATVVQLDPIYANFNVSEQDVQKIRANLMKRGIITIADLKQIPVEIGLQTEDGYPHKGMLDYVSPNLDPSTGTIAARARFDNAGRPLLPGYFVRVRVPLTAEPDMLLVPDRAIGADQSGRYVLVVNKDDVVEQRTVEIGQMVGELRVVTRGVAADDRVLVSGLLTAVPGDKVEPQLKTLTAQADPPQ